MKQNTDSNHQLIGGLDMLEGNKDHVGYFMGTLASL
jgi:hypothetical protein